MPGSSPLPLAVSMGEPAGIGPDLILAMHADREALGLPPFVVFGNPGFLASRAKRLGLDTRISEVAPIDAEAAFANGLPVVPIDGLVPDKPGEASAISAQVVIESIAQAVQATMTGRCRGVVTAPIHKRVLTMSGFSYPGHTEFIAALCSNGGPKRMPVMMLCHEELRVVPVTVHVPISAVPGLLTPDLVTQTVRIVAHDLRTRFGIEDPRIAVAGLNPHAGEGGTIGTEDINLVAPAISTLAASGITVVGPLPADTLFHLPHWRQYDAVIAMYHDQALIPIKTVAFDQAVNITLGLPLVRTSPDHGTAFDLAGTGKGSQSSFLAAIRMADKLTHAAGG